MRRGEASRGMDASRSADLVEPPRNPRQRLAPEHRRKQILNSAVSYFAEVGFDGGTRELARRAGVTQPLIYRYFPSKELLIRAVYEEVYLTRWEPEWERLLADTGQPIRDRLVTFYERYTAVIFTPEWLRIYLFAGLRGLEINRWWMTFVEQHLLRRIAEAMRGANGLPSTDARPVGSAELELYWLFHGGIFYYGLRRDVYQKRPDLSLRAFIRGSVDAMLVGLPPVLATLLDTDSTKVDDPA
jgi:AcrR family transcriptional regulator